MKIFNHRRKSTVDEIKENKKQPTILRMMDEFHNIS